jgi:uncharacterized protein (DUF1697 family)
MLAFLGGEGSAAALRALAEADFGEERVVVRGREVYLWLPGGITGSKAGKALADAKLGVPVTVRNRNTVQKLLALTS